MASKGKPRDLLGVPVQPIGAVVDPPAEAPGGDEGDAWVGDYEDEGDDYVEPPTEQMKQRMDEITYAQKARHLSLMVMPPKRASKNHVPFSMHMHPPSESNPKGSPGDADGKQVAVGLRKFHRLHRRTNSNPIRDRRSLLFHTALGEREPLLPSVAKNKEGRITLVLDMDETLIHSEGQELNVNIPPKKPEDYEAEGLRPPDFTIDVPEFQQRFAVYKRPFVHEFLREASRDFEVVVFTAGCEQYASRLLDVLDPEGYIHHRLYRQHTTTVGEQAYVKDMTGLDRDIRRIVLVDNSWYVMEATPDNCIPIKDFYGDLDDRELERLLQVLVSLKDEKDVRNYLRRTFNVKDSLNRVAALQY